MTEFRSLRFALCWLVAAGFAGVTGSAAAREIACASGPVAVSIDFEGAGRHSCVVAEDGEIRLSVEPEATPINPSPWYAFRLESPVAQAASVLLRYGEAEHRYAPQVSIGAGPWRALPGVAVDRDGRRARLTVAVPAGQEVIVAAQPIETPAQTHAWAQATLSGRADLEIVTYGGSLDGRPLTGYALGRGPRLVVALTRQHPPEVTGALAFRAFVERLITAPEAQAFLATHRVLLAPAPNPDGVVRGHWRNNAGGMDLNRDWGDFTQPETRALRDWILSEAKGRETLAFFDFHSTRRSVIYAPPRDAPSPAIGLLDALKARLDALPAPVPWSYAHNAASGVSKAWALEALRAPGLTLELSDAASLAEAQAVGAATADATLAFAGVRLSAPASPGRSP